MRLAIMQPYFLPYIGYFQLLAAVDKFVLLDDVNFINRGWINRNRIIVQGQPHWLTIPIVKASQNKLIHELEILDEPGWKTKMIRMVNLNYKAAPSFKEVGPLFESLIAAATGSLSAFLFLSLKTVASYLDLRTVIEPTSTVYPKGDLKGADRILDICVREGADTYLNLPGGRDLYDDNVFASGGIKLMFLRPQLLERAPLPNTESGSATYSILDHLMHYPASAIRASILSAEFIGGSKFDAVN